MCGARERGVHGGRVAKPVAGDDRAVRGRARRHRDRQRRVLGRDRLGAVAGGVLGFADHHRDRLAAIAHHIARERP